MSVRWLVVSWSVYNNILKEWEVSPPACSLEQLFAMREVQPSVHEEAFIIE